ncbi:hypothetical protein [Desulforhopalus sp. IMCC35007]|uniref:hypothetical protein n=1 Tax=Desulforhopalus sp. IMCC35007 TaxID=2569543 RepID=UPI00145F1E9E|nr:hypothetical protein [Desulforhopalus sp. IMCC35007]
MKREEIKREKQSVEKREVDKLYNEKKMRCIVVRHFGKPDSKRDASVNPAFEKT